MHTHAFIRPTLLHPSPQSNSTFSQYSWTLVGLTLQYPYLHKENFSSENISNVTVVGFALHGRVRILITTVSIGVKPDLSNDYSKSI